MNQPTTTTVHLDDLHEPEDKNPNVMPKEDFALLERAIGREGFLQPVLARRRPGIDGGFVLIDGVHRCRAARNAGLSAVPCLVIDVSDETAVMLRIAMNKLRGELDLATVARQIEELHGTLSLEELAATGYSETALGDLLKMAAEDSPEDALAQLGADPGTSKEDDDEVDPDAPAHTLELALLVSRRRFLSIKRRLRKLGNGDMGQGLLELLDQEEEDA